jgi:hypothetical protein
VAAVRGIIFQSDGRSAIGRLLIRPFEAIDRWLAGVLPHPRDPSLAMHAGIHVELDDGREIVAEQLVGTLYMDLVSGMSWTPIDQFRARDRGGWDVTVPATSFRGADPAAEREVVERLNAIEGHPFVGEDCTAFVERAFGGRRLFADSPLLQMAGIPARVGDPALPLLKSDARLDDRAERLLRAEALRKLPEAVAEPKAPNIRLWTGRVLTGVIVGTLFGRALARRRGKKRN